MCCHIDDGSHLILNVFILFPILLVYGIYLFHCHTTLRVLLMLSYFCKNDGISRRHALFSSERPLWSYLDRSSGLLPLFVISSLEFHVTS